MRHVVLATALAVFCAASCGGGGGGSSGPPAAPVPDVTFLTQTLGLGSQGDAYNASIAVQGGIGPYTYAVSGGALPAGMQLDAQTGALTGTPAIGGRYTFEVTVQDARVPPHSAAKEFTLDLLTLIVPAPLDPKDRVVASLGLEAGLFATFVRGTGMGDQRLVWADVDYANMFAAASLPGHLRHDGNNLETEGAARLPARGTGNAHAMWDSAAELDGWIWIETPGAVTFTLTGVKDAGRLFFDGREIAAVDDAVGTPEATVGNVVRGLHRFAYVHRNRTGSISFDVKIQETGDDAPRTVPGDRLFFGPAVDELPLVEKTAVLGHAFEHRLSVRGAKSEPVFTVLEGGVHDGLTLGADGIIRGAPLVTGTRYFTVRVRADGNTYTTRRFALHVLSAPPTQTRNDSSEFCVTFDGAMTQANGLDYTQLAGSGNLGLGDLRLYPNYREGTWSTFVADIGALGSDKSFGFKDAEFGFYLSGDQKEHLSDYYPAFRQANRFAMMFKVPDELTTDKGRPIKLAKHGPAVFRHMVLQSLHLAGHNVTRYDGHRKEERNWHFYHTGSSHWPDEWKARFVRYLGDGWWYFETSDQAASQRSGSPSLGGSYNPVESYGRDYYETLSRFYVKLVGQKATPANVYPDGTFYLDNLRAWRTEGHVAIRSADGKNTARVVVAESTTTLEIPFQVAYTGAKPMAYRVARDPQKVPEFGGDGIHVDENGNGRIDPGEPSLDGKRFTPELQPGETHRFVYRLDVSGVPVDEVRHFGVILRAHDPDDLFSLDGDSLPILVFKATNPDGVAKENVFVNVSTPTPYDEANRAPEVTITTAPATGRVGEALTFSGTATDADGPKGTRPHWDFGDDSPYDFGTTVTHTFKAPGTYKVRLYATDSLARTVVEKTIVVTE